MQFELQTANQQSLGSSRTLLKNLGNLPHTVSSRADKLINSAIEKPIERLESTQLAEKAFFAVQKAQSMCYEKHFKHFIHELDSESNAKPVPDPKSKKMITRSNIAIPEIKIPIDNLGVHNRKKEKLKPPVPKFRKATEGDILVTSGAPEIDLPMERPPNKKYSVNCLSQIQTNPVPTPKRSIQSTKTEFGRFQSTSLLQPLSLKNSALTPRAQIPSCKSINSKPLFHGPRAEGLLKSSISQDVKKHTLGFSMSNVNLPVYQPQVSVELDVLCNESPSIFSFTKLAKMSTSNKLPLIQPALELLSESERDDDIDSDAKTVEKDKKSIVNSNNRRIGLNNMSKDTEALSKLGRQDTPKLKLHVPDRINTCKRASSRSKSRNQECVSNKKPKKFATVEVMKFNVPSKGIRKEKQALQNSFLQNHQAIMVDSQVDEDPLKSADNLASSEYKADPVELLQSYDNTGSEITVTVTQFKAGDQSPPNEYALPNHHSEVLQSQIEENQENESEVEDEIKDDQSHDGQPLVNEEVRTKILDKFNLIIPGSQTVNLFKVACRPEALILIGSVKSILSNKISAIENDKTKILELYPGTDMTGEAKPSLVVSELSFIALNSIGPHHLSDLLRSKKISREAQNLLRIFHFLHFPVDNFEDLTATPLKSFIVSLHDFLQERLDEFMNKTNLPFRELNFQQKMTLEEFVASNKAVFQLSYLQDELEICHSLAFYIFEVLFYHGMKKYLKLIENRKDVERNRRNSVYEMHYLDEKKQYFFEMLQQVEALEQML
jgi:hypothetical protein